jgi:hypothetical protein
MRTKSIIFFLALLSLTLNSTASSVAPLLGDLTTVQVDALAAPMYTKQELPLAVGKMLFVTRDYGSGMEIRDAYVYRWAGDMWALVSYRRSSSASLTARIQGKNLEVLTKAGKLVLSLPTESLLPKFDQQER